MPYFKNDQINLLFIHIPKTGGTSIDLYFSYKYNIRLHTHSLYSNMSNINVKFNNVSLQHQTYKTIMNNINHFNINTENLKILSVVRNPYHRIMSDLFFYKKLNKYSTPEETYLVIEKYLQDYLFYNINLDNHVTPQYLFLLNNKNQIDENIIILKQEKLKEMMIINGYEDFDMNCQISDVCDQRQYMKYLNQKSILLINFFYKKDFLFQL